jgi:hypothetical protein
MAFQLPWRPLLQSANDVPRIALAPSFPLVGVPSNSIIILSNRLCSNTSNQQPRSYFGVHVLHRLQHALCLNIFFLSPSRSSTASWVPVDAPEGTAARPNAPDSVTTSTSIVGLPRLSRICRRECFQLSSYWVLFYGLTIEYGLHAFCNIRPDHRKKFVKEIS